MIYSMGNMDQQEAITVPDYVIRVMRKEDIPQVIDIRREASQPDSTRCVYTFHEVDPAGIYVAATDSGEILGQCSAILNSKNVAFMGYYGVREKYRGKGIGLRLWKACLEHVGETNCGLNAVPGKVELYRDRGGFPIEETEWFSVCCHSVDDVDPNNLLDAVDGVQVQAFKYDEDFPLVLKYDEDLIGYNREKIVTMTVREEDSVTYVALDECDARCVGYGILKLSIYGGGQVGPLYADSTEIAEVILRRSIECLPEARGLSLMMINTNEGAKSIVEKLGLKWVEECPRCYTKEKCHVDRNKIFGHLNMNFTPF